MNDRNTIRWFAVEPVDAWFFGNSKPSNRGEDQADLESIFPPHATTVVGALRAAFARQQGWAGRGDWPVHLKEILGDGFDDLGKLQFTGPFLQRSTGEENVELLFSMPRHVLGHTCHDNDSTTFKPQAWLEPRPTVSDLGENVHLPAAPRHQDPRTKAPGAAEGFFLTGRGLERVLEGQLPEEAHCVHWETLFAYESRIGIAFDSDSPERRATGEGQIYSPRYIRLKKDVALTMGVQGLPSDWQVPELLPLGGESRLATCRELDGNQVSLPSPEPLSEEEERAVLILLTPTRLAQSGHGWCGPGPGGVAAELHENLAGAVVTAAIDRPIRIGGWDFKKTTSRSLEPFIPAGSIWWLNQSPAMSSLLLGVQPHIAYGYGYAVVGRLPQKQSSREEIESGVHA